MVDTPSPQKPKSPNNAAEAAETLLRALPRVRSLEDGKYYFGYYRDGKPVFIPNTLDRTLVLGTFQGIAQRRVVQGDKTLLGNLNAAFIRPIEAAITEASKPLLLAGAAASDAPLNLLSASKPNPDLTENRQLLNALLNGIDWAASFGIFSDQALELRHGKHLNPVGFGAKPEEAQR